jgi:hypothetical protein
MQTAIRNMETTDAAGERLHACEEILNIHTYNLLSLEQEDWPLPSEKVRARLQSMFPGMRAWQEVSLEGSAERATELYC